jgi:hypothetical protein
VLARLGERRVAVAAQVLEALAEQLMHPGEQGGKAGRPQAGAKATGRLQRHQEEKTPLPAR